MTADVVGFPVLAELSRRLTGDPRWPGPAVLVARECRPNLDGSASGRVARYADPAPWIVVPHELAHIASGDRDHGPAWREWYTRLVTWTVELA